MPAVPESSLVGKKIEWREGTEFEALIAVASSDWVGLGQRIAAAIEKSQLGATGLQAFFELPTVTELLRPIKLYSTGNTTKEQLERLLLSVPGVEGVRALSVRHVKWSEKYHPEYDIDFPHDLFDPAIPSHIEFACGAARCAAKEPDYVLDDAYDEDSSFATPAGLEAEGFDVNPSPPSKAQIVRNKRLRNAKAVWEHHQTDGYKRDVRSTSRKK